MPATSEEALQRKKEADAERKRKKREAERQQRQAAEEEARRKAEEQQQKAAKKRENDRLRIAAKRRQNNMSHQGMPARPNRSATAMMLQPSPVQSALAQRILDPNTSVDDALRFAVLAAPGDAEAARTQQVMMQEAERTQQEAARTQQVMMQEAERTQQEAQRTQQEAQRTQQERFRLDRTELERMTVAEIGMMDGGNQTGAVIAWANRHADDEKKPAAKKPAPGKKSTANECTSDDTYYGGNNNNSAGLSLSPSLPDCDISGSPLRGAVDHSAVDHSAAAQASGGFNPNYSAHAGTYGHHSYSTAGEFNPYSSAHAGDYGRHAHSETMTSERPGSASSFSSSSNQNIPEGDLSGQVGMHPKKDPRTCEGKRTLAAPTPTKKKRAKTTDTPSNGGRPPRSMVKKKTSTPSSTRSTRLLRSASKK